MEAIGQLTGGIAHDFNNLLSVMSNGLEVLQIKGYDPDQAQIMESMRRAVERGATLTQQQLSFSRQQPLAPAKHNVSRIVSGFEAVLRRAGNSTISFVFRLADDLLPTVIDAPRLETALLNLVVNARDAMPDGGTLSVESANVTLADKEVGSLPAGQYVRVSVSDTGMGMAPDVLARAYEPFFTTKEIGKGTGLGLSQVYGFISQSGGAIDITSEIDVGTTVSLYLPAIINASIEASEDEAESDTVLVVDDEPDVLNLSAALFRSMGYEVLTASNGHDALDLLKRQNDISVLFSDVMMPKGMTGVELALHARKLRPDLKVLLASGYSLPALKAQHAGIEQFPILNKPFKLAELAKKLRAT